MLQLTTDKHEASCGLSATAELLVSFVWMTSATTPLCTALLTLLLTHSLTVSAKLMCLFFQTDFSLPGTLLAWPILVWQSLWQLPLFGTKLSRFFNHINYWAFYFTSFSTFQSFKTIIHGQICLALYSTTSVIIDILSHEVSMSST